MRVDGHTWDMFARRVIRRGRRVVVPDLRGHGRSGRAPSYLFGEFGSDLEAMTGLVPGSRVVAVASGRSVHRDRFAEFDAAVGPFLAEHQETPRPL